MSIPFHRNTHVCCSQIDSNQYNNDIWVYIERKEEISKLTELLGGVHSEMALMF